MSSVVETIEKIVVPILDEQQFELVDIEYVKEGKQWFLRVFIDKNGGIDIEECAWVSEQLSEQIDKLGEDFIPQAYFLEVSSPGAERPLKKESDYEKAIGNYIHVSLYRAIDGNKQYEGYLTEFDAESLSMIIKDKTREKTMTFARNDIAKARLAVHF